MFEITIRLLATYRQYLPQAREYDSGYRLRIEPGSRVSDLLQILPVPIQATSVLLNGRHAEQDKELVDGDVVAIFPAVGGGE